MKRTLFVFENTIFRVSLVNFRVSRSNSNRIINRKSQSKKIKIKNKSGVTYFLLQNQ